jgi:uncharacterized protein (TIGR02001 family)
MSGRLLAACTVLLALAAPAYASDLPSKKKAAPPPPPPAVSPWDFAFGGKAQSDYNFRGISQTDRKPGVMGYGEVRYDNFYYAGVAAYSVDLPTKPLAEVDVTAGIRPTLGPVSFDLGGIYYYYPREDRPNTGYVSNSDFFELAAKASYVWNEKVTFGANAFYTWNWLGTGADGTYISGTLKVALPYNLSASGEVGRYFLGTQTKPASVNPTRLADYTYWNAGLTYTWKQVSLDARYHGTDLTKANCYTLTGDPGAVNNRSKWCGDAFIATLAVDFVYSDLKK